jgi:hypothetical protein
MFADVRGGEVIIMLVGGTREQWLRYKSHCGIQGLPAAAATNSSQASERALNTGSDTTVAGRGISYASLTKITKIWIHESRTLQYAPANMLSRITDDCLTFSTIPSFEYAGGAGPNATNEVGLRVRWAQRCS